MKGSSRVLLAAILSLATSGATADSLHIRDMPLAGDYGGRNGHTIIVDGKICRLRNSAAFSAPQGCNYEIRAGRDGDESLHATTTNAGCSLDCEPQGFRDAPSIYVDGPAGRGPAPRAFCPRPRGTIYHRRPRPKYRHIRR